MRAEHERGHARATDVLRVHDAVRARAPELLLAVDAARPRHDEDVRPRRAGAERDERVLGVLVDGRDHRTGAPDPGLGEHRVLRRVAEDGRVRAVGEACRVVVDHHQLTAGGGDLGRDRAPDATPPAHDHMVPHRRNGPFHSSSPDEVLEPTLEEGLDEHAEGVESGADPEQDQHHREDLPRRVEWLDLAEAHRRHGGDGLVHRVEGAEAEDHVADGPDDQHREQERERAAQPSPVVHAPDATTPGPGCPTPRVCASMPP